MSIEKSKSMQRLLAFRRALSKEDQEAFGRLFKEAIFHTSTGVYIAHSWPRQTILLSICLEHGKVTAEILSKFREKKV